MLLAVLMYGITFSVLLKVVNPSFPTKEAQTETVNALPTKETQTEAVNALPTKEAQTEAVNCFPHVWVAYVTYSGSHTLQPGLPGGEPRDAVNGFTLCLGCKTHSSPAPSMHTMSRALLWQSL